MKTTAILISILITGIMAQNHCSGQVSEDSLLACKAYHSLKSANIVNGISIAFGVASNIEMLAIGGFPLEVDEGLNPGLNLSHMVFGLTRVGTSIVPPCAVARARKALAPWRNSPEMETSCKKLFQSLDAAQVLTAVAPVLVISGGIMMVSASTNMEYYEMYDPGTSQYDYQYTLKNKGLKTTGWIFVGAGLAASVSSAILVGICKQELAAKIGTFRLSAGDSGVGVQYNLP